MGLDWRPLNKPKPGHEGEFESLFTEIRSSKNDDEGVPALQERLWAISISPYETLGAPRVGRDPQADEWASAVLSKAALPEKELNARRRAMDGFYVVPLVPPCDGIPKYISPRTAFEGKHIDTEVFRAQFLQDCRHFIGELYEEAFQSKLAADLETYGRRLLSAAEAFAAPRALTALREQRNLPDKDDADASAAHIAYWAAKWCLFWGSRGHGVHADW